MDLFILGIFLIVTLIVGLSYGRQVKTIQDYALGGKNFSTYTLVATIVATFASGSGLFIEIENTYTSGLYFIIAILGVPLNLWISSRMVVRMGEFMHYVSVAEAMGSMYGRTVQVITACSSILAKAGYIAVQFKAMAKMLEVIFYLDGTVATSVAAGIVIFYSASGGIKAVAFTDVLQFLTFGAVIPTLALVVWNNTQSAHTSVIDTLATNPIFHPSKIISWDPKFFSMLGLLLYFGVPKIYVPSVFQRIVMSKNIHQAKRALIYSAGAFLLVLLITIWIGCLLLADQPGLAKNEIIPYMINQHTYVGLRGLLGAGIMALAMSTADSSLNALSVMFANDLVKPLPWKWKAQDLIVTAKIFSVAMGFFALLMALYKEDILNLLLLSGSFYMPVFAVPMLMAVLGFRTSKRAVLLSMFAGFTTAILWSFFFSNVNSIPPGMLANFIMLLGSHYLLGEPGGWQKIAPDSPLALARAARREAWQRRKEAIKNFRLYPYLQKNLPQQEGIYTLFGLYTIAATYTGFYTIGDSNIQSHRDIYEAIYHTVLFITTAFITFPIWPHTVKSYRFMTFFWPLGIGAILFFAGTLLVAISQFHTMQVMVLIINLMIAVLLLQWSLAILLALSGISLAVLFFQYYTGEALLWNLMGSLQFNILYGLLLVTSLLIALFGNKQAFAQLGKENEALQIREKDQQKHLMQVAAEKQAALAALQHTGVEKLLTMARELHSIRVAEEDKERMQSLQTELLPIAFHLQGIDTKSQDYLRLQASKLPLKSWCSQIKAKATQKGITLNVYCRHDAKADEINCDTDLLTSLLVRSMLALNEQVAGLEGKPDIFCLLEDTQLSYPMPDVKKGYMKYVPALRIAMTVSGDLPALAKSYQPDLAGSVYSSPTTAEDLVKLGNSRIIKSHYGYAEVTDDTLIYVVPVDIEDVRPKDMDKEYMEVGAKPVRADDHFRNEKGIDAQVQESTFLADVAARSEADLGMVKMALETIKWYHGPKNRNSGEPFYLHPLAVAQIVLDYNQDEATILGALLHDTVEDTPMQLEHIEALFGKEVAEVVDVVTHLQSIEGSIYKVKMSASENLQMLDRTDSKRGLYVKIADRMHNMRTIGGHRKVSKRKLIAQETLDFFVPLSEKLGLHKAAQEFEKMCYEVLKKKN